MILICVVSALDVTLISCVPCCFMSHEKEKEFINAKEYNESKTLFLMPGIQKRHLYMNRNLLFGVYN